MSGASIAWTIELAETATKMLRSVTDHPQPAGASGLRRGTPVGAGAPASPAPAQGLATY